MIIDDISEYANCGKLLAGTSDSLATTMTGVTGLKLEEGQPLVQEVTTSAASPGAIAF